MSVEYKYMYDEGCLVECDSCQSVAPLAAFDPYHENEKCHFCEVCSGSLISRITMASTRDPNKDLYVIIAQVGNVILDKITGRKPVEE
jgi:MinD superfamily P-loop ATPase